MLFELVCEMVVLLWCDFVLFGVVVEDVVFVDVLYDYGLMVDWYVVGMFVFEVLWEVDVVWVECDVVVVVFICVFGVVIVNVYVYEDFL